MPEPEFADDADGFALGDGQIDVLDRAHGAAPGVEFDGQVAHVEQRQRLVFVVRDVRFSMSGPPLRIDQSRKPSPRD